MNRYLVTHINFLSKRNSVYLLCVDLSDEKSSTSISTTKMWLRWLFTHLLSYDLSPTISSPNNNNTTTLFKILLVGVKADRCSQLEFHPLIQHLDEICELFSMLPIHNKCLITSSFEGIGRDKLIQSMRSITTTILKSGNNFVPGIIKVVEKALHKQHKQLIISQESLIAHSKFPKVCFTPTHVDYNNFHFRMFHWKTCPMYSTICTTLESL